MSNKGFEALLRTTNLDQRNIQWLSTITYTTNKNLVDNLEILDFTSAGGYPNRIRTGKPAGVFYGSYAARNCATGALLVDSLGRYRRSNQTVDMGATLAACPERGHRQQLEGVRERAAAVRRSAESGAGLQRPRAGHLPVLDRGRHI